MNKIILALVLILFCADGDKPKTALIPFATEAYTAKYLKPDEVQWIKKSVTKLNGPAAVSDSGIGIGYTNLAEHLIEYHKCPKWVVDMYSPDPVLLWRIHEGYELEYQRDEYKEKDKMSLEMRNYYAKMRAEYQKEFQMMKVTGK